MDTTMKATARFVTDDWAEIDSRQHGDAAVGHARLSKTFTGDIVGTSRVDMLGPEA